MREFQGSKVWYSGCLPCDISEPWALKKPLFFSLILWTWSFEAPQLCTVWSLNRERNSQIKKKKLLFSTYCIVCIHLVWVPSFFGCAEHARFWEVIHSYLKYDTRRRQSNCFAHCYFAIIIIFLNQSYCYI